MSKKRIATVLITLLIGISIQAQPHYLSVDYSVSAFKPMRTAEISNGITKKLNRCEGNYTGAAYHFSWGNNHSLGLGLGFSKIHYQKEWLGIFPENNRFGAALVNGQIGYWSVPVSYTRTSRVKAVRKFFRCGGYRRDLFRLGFRITYIASFETSNSFSVQTLGGADYNTFRSSFSTNEQSFQHNLTIGLSSQLLIFDSRMQLEIEPYAGFGSNYFKESGNGFNMVSYGARLRIGIHAKLPKIHIEREVDKGNAEEKKKLLEQKQKEIQEQLNKNPK